MVASRIVSKKMIKPSSPTPPSLRCHNLSLMDCVHVPQYIPMAFFYSLPENRNITISHILESSLSKVLSCYYPFAGQIKDDNTYVDCNDTGVEYLNVQVSCPMSEILNHPYNDVVEVVFPPDLPWSDSSNRSLLVVQLSEFDCGGIALSVCLSHRIADGYSVGKFFKDWASVARDDELDFKPSPQFNGASLFPLTNGPPVLTSPNTGDQPQRNVSRMYHLSSSNLDKLKVDATNSGVVQNPTRIEVATALVHKCATSALGVSKPIVLVHAMNLRPPIPLNTIGNCVTIFTAMTMTKDEINLPNLVVELRKAKQQLREELKNMNTNEIGAHLLEKVDHDQKEWDIDVYFYTSFCHFGLDAIDFGWGRPVRVTLVTNPRKNFVIFMDEPNGDGINVLITLTEADMLVFQSNKKLLQFASPIGDQVKIKDTTCFKKEQVRVQLTRTGILKISGQRPVAGQNKWLRFQKDFPVSQNCDKTKISAKFENGILYVKQPKLITSTEKKDQELPPSDAQQTKKPADEPQPTPQKKDEEQTKGKPTPTEELPKHQATNADKPGKEEPNTKETKDLAENTPAEKTSASSTVEDGNKPENNANIGTAAVLAEKLKMPRELMNLTLIALLVLVIGLYISKMMKSNNYIAEE